MGGALNKDQAILTTLDRLRDALGPGAFDAVDHWDADLIAVGIAAPWDHRVLVYITVSEDGYYAELELPPAPDDELPYRVAGRYSGLTFDQLSRVVSEHLATPRT